MVIQELVCLVQSSAHLLGALDAIVEHQRLAVVGQREQEVKDRVEICIVGGKQPGGEMPAAQSTLLVNHQVSATPALALAKQATF